MGGSGRNERGSGRNERREWEEVGGMRGGKWEE